ncbi:cellulose synthase operon protein YhjQ/BcsQ [Sphingomonas faeni]|uniref:cellulose synthase operon protein YhjQ/BcsQ n=1 Tax=Sphingomonas faeni TaxID=185950 RepID=UPI0020C7671C|nr:cellulose synthase operon protein YhjQ/BcsQ [Sphingomonas faeni]MCP8889886.1 ATPase [Sphingomonas faeni]
MPLILCHSPVGGVGTTFLTAHLALGLASRGYDVTAIDFTHADALKLFFGMLPTQEIPAMTDAASEGIVVDGVELLSGHAAAQSGSFGRLLAQHATSPFDDDRIVIADVASADLALKTSLLSHAALHLCALAPQPTSLAALAKVQPGTPTIDLEQTVFVLNQLDDTRKLSRHSQIFLRALFGEKLIATVRRDEAVNEALASFQPVARYAKQSVVLSDLATLTAAIETRCGFVSREDRAQ